MIAQLAEREKMFLDAHGLISKAANELVPVVLVIQNIDEMRNFPKSPADIGLDQKKVQQHDSDDLKKKKAAAIKHIFETITGKIHKT